MAKKGEQGVSQHKRIAMGEDVARGSAKAFKHGGQALAPRDKTEFKRYGNGFRKHSK